MLKRQNCQRNNQIGLRKSVLTVALRAHSENHDAKEEIDPHLMTKATTPLHGSARWLTTSMHKSLSAAHRKTSHASPSRFIVWIPWSSPMHSRDRCVETESCGGAKSELVPRDQILSLGLSKWQVCMGAKEIS
jgi:hypothetical protein